MQPITLVEAVNQALFYAMEHDPNVLVLGEDVALNGGVFRATVGLHAAFGSERVLDTPLAESMIAGMAIGMATQGLKPVAEFQFMGFIYSAVDQIISHAARMRHRTQGRLTCPLVYRAPYGAGIRGPEHHSESTEAVFAQIPGLRVVVPSSPLQAYGLLLSAIHNPDPVLFLEPKRVYRSIKQRVPNDGKTLPMDRCFIQRQGTDITLVGWGAMLYEIQCVADQLALRGISAEIIDVATLNPLDVHSILQSVHKTGRCVVVHEAPGHCGVGAEICAQIAQKALLSLLAPVRRVTGYDTVVPYAKREQHYMPSVYRILNTVNEVLSFQY